jgi:hypothetical protein
MSLVKVTSATGRAGVCAVNPTVAATVAVSRLHNAGIRAKRSRDIWTSALRLAAHGNRKTRAAALYFRICGLEDLRT